MAGHPMDELQAAVMQPERERQILAKFKKEFTSSKCTDGDMKIVF